MPTIALDDLLVEGRFGPLTRGAMRADVLAALGPPDAHAYGMPVERAAFWAYGETHLGHLELSFLEDDRLVSVFSDHLPIRRHRCAAFTLEPGCLGGRWAPSLARVQAALARRGVQVQPKPREGQWQDGAPPPKELRRLSPREWKKICAGLPPDCIEETFHAQIFLPSGVVLGIGSQITTLPSGERVAEEDVIIVVSALMTR